MTPATAMRTGSMVKSAIRATFQLVGLSPLMQNASKSLGMTLTGLPPEEQAEARVWKNEKGEFFHPGMGVYNSMLFAIGRDTLSTPKKVSAKSVLAGAVRVETDECIIVDPKTGEPVKSYEVDSRLVILQTVPGKPAILAHRPKFWPWAMLWTVRISSTISRGGVELVENYLNDAGERVGVGSFRPWKKGPFGTFSVDIKDIQDIER